MDKSCGDGDSTSSNNNNSNSRDQYLRQLNKLSQKISKPVIKSHHPQPQPPPPPPPQPHAFNSNSSHHHQQNLQHQPPVYNINKSDFRDVVQKLTGSPAHDRISTPPPINQPKPPSSRLQRIRPPPLPQIANRPPPMLAASPGAVLPPPQPSQPALNAAGFGRPVAPPLSPLPPLPAVHAAAESPVSAYLRYMQGSMDQSSKQFSGFSTLAPRACPRWNSFPPQQVQSHPQPQFQPQLQAQLHTQPRLQPPPQQPQPHFEPQVHTQPRFQPQPQVLPPTQPEQQQQPPPPPQQPAATQQQQAVVPSLAPPGVSSPLQFPMPLSPSPFGCLNSPISSYNLFSPSLLFSPNSGQLGFPQLPLSPTVPVPSPIWRGL